MTRRRRPHSCRNTTTANDGDDDDVEKTLKGQRTERLAGSNESPTTATFPLVLSGEVRTSRTLSVTVVVYSTCSLARHAVSKTASLRV